MKLARKIIALAIVLCTLGAMMIPGVSAAKTVTTTYDLIATRNALGIGTSWMFSSNYDAWKTIMNAYTAETPTSNWMLDSTSAMQGKFGTKINNTYPLYFQVKNTMSTNLLGMAFRVKAPATGNFTLNVNYMQGVDALLFREAGAYVWEAPETYYDETNKAYYASGSAWTVLNGGNSAYTVAKGLDDAGEAPVVTFAPYNADATAYTAVDAIGETQFALTEGKEYIIYIYGVNSAEVAAEISGNAIMYFSSFKLVQHFEEAPETPWDPSANTDLVVDFVDTGDYDITDNAGVTTGSWLSTKSASLDLLDAAYAAGTNKWTMYRNEGTAVHSVYSSKNYTPGYLQVYTPEKELNTFGYLPILFKAPGSGEYTLSVTDSAVKWANNVDVTAHVFQVPEEGFTKASLIAAASAADPLISYNPTVDKEAVTTQVEFNSEKGAVTLQGGKDYVLVIGVKAAAGQQCVFLRGFALREAKAAATIGSTPYNTLNDALDAAEPGDTIKLGADATAAQLNLPAGVAIDLNGKTLTAEAVVGEITDSTDGAGLLAVAQESAILAPSGVAIALWDNNEEAPGYRFFAYEMSNVGISAGEDDVTSISKFIDLYEAERILVGAENLDENGEVIKGTGDKRYKDVADDLAALYAAGTIDWRYEYTSQQYQMGRGGVCFSWGNKSLRHYGAGFSAIRIQAPGEGKVSVKVKTSSAGSEASDGGFDMYIVKASDIEAACADYAASYATFLADPATAVADMTTAYAAAIEANEPVVTGVSNGEAYTGTFEFEANKEYIVIFNNNGSVKGALHMNFQSISFTRQEKHGATQTFVSKLAFTNEAAYALIATGESGLNAGFVMNWNGVEKTFQYDAATLANWAKAELSNPEKDYGLYIRISGFEALEESGTLTGTFYANGVNVGEPLSYEFVK